MIELHSDLRKAIEQIEMHEFRLEGELLDTILAPIAQFRLGGIYKPPNEASRESLRDLKNRTNLRTANSFAEIRAAAQIDTADVE